MYSNIFIWKILESSVVTPSKKGAFNKAESKTARPRITMWSPTPVSSDILWYAARQKECKQIWKWNGIQSKSLILFFNIFSNMILNQICHSLIFSNMILPKIILSSYSKRGFVWHAGGQKSIRGRPRQKQGQTSWCGRTLHHSVRCSAKH